MPVIDARLLQSAIASLTTALLVGCGGSHHDSHSGGGVAADLYAGFGYTETLYLGTFTTNSPDGTPYSGSIAISARADGSTFNGFPITTDAHPNDRSGYLYKSAANGTTFSLPLRAGNDDGLGTSTFRLDGRTLSITFDGGNGAFGSVMAVADAPDATPARPPTGTYVGKDYMRGSLTGVLTAIQDTTGTIAADGGFQFTNNLPSGTQGILRGTIAKDGTVTVTDFVRDAQSLDPSSFVARAYGTAKDFTLVFRNPNGNMIGDTYRLRRTGD